MTTPTREQVVQIVMQAHAPGLLAPGYSESLAQIIALARADLEATIAEQATEISKLISAVADHVTVRAEQRQQLADEQSKVKVLTDALEEAKKYSAIWPQHIDRLIDEALATVKEERCPKT